MSVLRLLVYRGAHMQKIAATVNVNDFSNLSKLARRAWAQEDWKGFHSLVNLLCRYHPERAETIFLAGRDLKAQGLRSGAKEAFKRALAMDASRYDAAIELADLESITRNPEAAFDLLETYTSMIGNSPLYADMAGTCYVNIGLPAKALPMHEIAHSLQPAVDIFASNLAASKGFIGDIEGAKSLYRTLLNRNPKNQRNHYHLARLERVQSNSHILEMRGVLTGDDARDVFLLNALGKEYEDLGHFDKAFECYRRSSDAIYAHLQHDVDVDIRMLDYQAERLSKLRISPSHPEPGMPTPIFIVGLPRTGSTLLEQMLARHESIETLGETDLIDAAIREVTQYNDSGQRLSTTLFEAYDHAPEPLLIREYYFRKAGYRLTGKPFFIDKMPYNFILIDKILAAFPEAIIINTLRDPIDTCLSMYKQIFTNAYLYSYSLTDLTRYYLAYRDYVSKLLSFGLPNVHQVIYEDLVKEPGLTLQCLLRSLGLHYSESLLMHNAERSVSMTASAGQIRSGIQDTYAHNWKNYEKHLLRVRDILYANTI